MRHALFHLNGNMIAKVVVRRLDTLSMSLGLFCCKRVCVCVRVCVRSHACLFVSGSSNKRVNNNRRNYLFDTRVTLGIIPYIAHAAFAPQHSRNQMYNVALLSI